MRVLVDTNVVLDVLLDFKKSSVTAFDPPELLSAIAAKGSANPSIKATST